MSRTVYLLERIKDGADWERGMRIYADAPCKGWRIIEKKSIRD